MAIEIGLHLQRPEPISIRSANVLRVAAHPRIIAVAQAFLGWSCPRGNDDSEEVNGVTKEGEGAGNPEGSARSSTGLDL
jgi:hypothetical protein